MPGKKILTDVELEAKLKKIAQEGHPKTITHNGKKLYISKAKIDLINQNKEGGFLPLILGAIGAIAVVTGTTVGIVEANKQSDYAKQKVDIEQKRLNLQKQQDLKINKFIKGEALYLPQYEKGNGFSDGLKAFANLSGLDDLGKKIIRKTLKPLSDKLNVVVLNAEDKSGSALLLIPK